MIYLNPGDKVWYPFHNDIVVQAMVQECNDIYDNGSKPALWHYRFLDQPSYVSFPTDQKDENGWHIYKRLTEDVLVLQEHARVNQLLWIDEPVGHDIQLGDECFLTLPEALANIRPTNRRHLKRRLKVARGCIRRFINHTWEVNGTEHPEFTRLPAKAVYVVRRRGR
jgi:hypothetical protein